MSRSRIVCVLLALITLLVYLPVRHHEFVNYDDEVYVSKNPVVRSGLTWAGVRWAFGTWHTSNWHPLTWLSHMLDCQMFGLHAGSHHLVSASFHAINAVLLFLLLSGATHVFWRSATVAALFAWHPLRVESVAWAAERKDVLCAFFGLLALIAYVRYTQRQPKAGDRAPGVKDRRMPVDARCSSADYSLTLLFLALGLMAKPMLVTLPFVMLLLDWWPLRRLASSTARRLVLEKWPFFALAAASCVVTFLAQQRGDSVASLQQFPLGLRLENAALGYAKYLLMSLCPIHLAVIYPLRETVPWSQALAAAAAVALISWWVWRARRRRPYLLMGWLWYLGMLVPVIGLVQVGRQPMADRYTYLPTIGVAIGVVFGAVDLAARLRLKPATLIPAAGLALAGCLIGTAHQLRFWQDSETLFTHALAVTRDNYIAHNNLGTVFMQNKDWDEAAVQFQEALEIRHHFPDAWYNLGMTRLEQERPDEAISCFQKLLQIQPGIAAAHNNLGTALLKVGRLEEASDQFQKAVDLQADDAEAHNNLGGTLMQRGRVDEAIVQFEKATALRPRYADAFFNFGIACLQKGRVTRAIDCFQKTLAIQPDYPKADYNLGMGFLRNRQADQAVNCLHKALEFQPRNVGVRNDLAWVLATYPGASLRNGAEAVELAAQADQLSGGTNPAVLSTLAAAYAEAGHFPQAIDAARRGIRLAAAREDAAKVNSLKTQLGCYLAGAPFRDTSLTNLP